MKVRYRKAPRLLKPIKSRSREKVEKLILKQALKRVTDPIDNLSITYAKLFPKT